MCENILETNPRKPSLSLFSVQSESVSASKQLPTVQEQRAAARDMVAYFKQKKYEE